MTFRVRIFGNGTGTQAQVADSPLETEFFAEELVEGYDYEDTMNAVGGTLEGAGPATEMTAFSKGVVSAEIVNAGVGDVGTHNVIGTTSGPSFFTLEVEIAGGGPATEVEEPPVILGIGYQPEDQITLTGGTFSSPVVLEVNTTGVSVIEEITNPGSGFTDGIHDDVIVEDAGEPFNVPGSQARVQVVVSGGVVTNINLQNSGVYVNNDDGLITCTVIPGPWGGTGLQFTVRMGVVDFDIVSSGDYSVIPTNPVSQGSSTGEGTGAQFNVFFGTGPITAINSVVDSGYYLADPTNPTDEPIASGEVGFDITGASVSVTLGLKSALLTDKGRYSVPPDTLEGVEFDGGAVFFVEYDGDPDTGLLEVFDAFGESSVRTALVKTGPESYVEATYEGDHVFDQPVMHEVVVNETTQIYEQNEEALSEVSPPVIEGTLGGFTGGLTSEILSSGIAIDYFHEGTNGIMEVQIFDRVLTEAEREEVRNNIKTAFEIS